MTTTIRDIDTEFKRRYAELSSVGSVSAEDERRLSDWYKSEVYSMMAEQAAAVVVERQAERQVEQAAERPANLCRDCQAPIAPTGKRGRPPVRCEKCRGAA